MYALHDALAVFGHSFSSELTFPGSPHASVRSLRPSQAV